MHHLLDLQTCKLLTKQYWRWFIQNMCLLLVIWHWVIVRSYSRLVKRINGRYMKVCGSIKILLNGRIGSIFPATTISLQRSFSRIVMIFLILLHRNGIVDILLSQYQQTIQTNNNYVWLVLIFPIIHVRYFWYSPLISDFPYWLNSYGYAPSLLLLQVEKELEVKKYFFVFPNG